MELNKEIQENGEFGEIDVQISPVGSFTGSSASGDPINENLDMDSLNRIAADVNSSQEEILVDVDHQSCKSGADKDTRAMGWISKLWTSAKGLFGKLKFTAEGREKVDGREYRFLSPVFKLGEDGKPLSIHSVAYTNTPAFKGFVEPILNCEACNTESSENLNKEKIIMEITKEELIDLIKETVTSMNQECDKKDEEKVENSECEKEEEKTEEVKNEDPVEEKQEEVKEEVKEEEKTEEINSEELPKTEEKEEKEEVIKEEVLNSSPDSVLPITESNLKTDEWKNLHGEAFFKWVSTHPECLSK